MTDCNQVGSIPPNIPDPVQFIVLDGLADVSLDSGEINADLPERFRSGRQHYPPPSDQHHHDVDLKLSLSLDIRDYVKSAEKIKSSTTKDAWLDKQELPGSDEIFGAGDSIELLPNKVSGVWKSTDRYLKCHYELLREDAISPLRDAVDIFRRDPEMWDDKSVAIYERVHIIGFTFTAKGIAARITFATRAGKRILWGSSKRLMPGTIIALTKAKDKFTDQGIICVVAARPLAGVDATPCEIDIFFASPEDVETDPHTEWLMVEAKTGYFEAARYTLAAFQKLSKESFPLNEHIRCQKLDVEPPAYVQEREKIDISAAVNNLAKGAFKDVNITQWPTATQTSLDQTQWEALEQLLTKKLAIIQGPPGTGKTYVSKVALEILIANRAEKDPPIIIAAQTNHALDQLLEHVAVFEPDYIRLGGRSTNPEVKKRALFEIRKGSRLPQIPGGLYGLAKKELIKLEQQCLKLLEPLHRHTGQPFTAQTFLDLKIISKQQSDSLENAAAEWVSADAIPENSMALWLNNSLHPFKVTYEAENFGVDEEDEDMEFEQLQELEAEAGVNDDEDVEILRGTWCAISDPLTANPASATTLDQAKRELDLKQNLNDIRVHLRPTVYSVLQEKAKVAIKVQMREVAMKYQEAVSEFQIGRWEKDFVFLRKANVIGMTTTGLSKYRPLISSLKPKIIIIEEAAEVIEAPITAACMESVEHLILVGDHQQLQGHCNISELEGDPYHLSMSMFERLVGNAIPFKTLLHQRRMMPEFRQLLQPLYPHLEDHDEVLNREPCDYGMGSRMSFFYDHEFWEDKDGQMSTLNDREAEFIAGFYKYLLQNSVAPQEITVLTFYNGQRKRILKYLRGDELTKNTYHNVKTVDSYQGEENQIVLLSLVRNNQDGRIGFLEVDNRVCVALSRAKRGFFLFGNAGLLQSNSPLWHKVITILHEEPRRIGIELPIVCQKHKKQTLVRYPEQWKAIDGGCDQPCGETLDCGHPCSLRCHPYDHDLLTCMRLCGRRLACGHDCKHKCCDMCRCSCATTGRPDDSDNVEGGSADDDREFGPDKNVGGPSWDNSSAPDPWSSNNGHSTTLPDANTWSQSLEVRGNNISPIHARQQGGWNNGESPQKGGNTQHIMRRIPRTLPLARGEGDRAARQTDRQLPPTRPSVSSTRSLVSGTTLQSSNRSQHYLQTYHQHSHMPWKQFADGGVKEDDLAKEAAEQKGVLDTSIRVTEIEQASSSGPSDERQVELADGRTRWHERFRFPGARNRKEDGVDSGNGSPLSISPSKSVNLLEFD